MFISIFTDFTLATILGISLSLNNNIRASLVFFFRNKISLIMSLLGFAVYDCGIIWSLLIPAIDGAEAQNIPGYIPAWESAFFRRIVFALN